MALLLRAVSDLYCSDKLQAEVGTSSLLPGSSHRDTPSPSTGLYTLPKVEQRLAQRRHLWVQEVGIHSLDRVIPESENLYSGLALQRPSMDVAAGHPTLRTKASFVELRFDITIDVTSGPFQILCRQWRK